MMSGGCTFRYSYSATPRILSASLGGFSGGGVLRVSGAVGAPSPEWYQIHVGSRESGFRCDVAGDELLDDAPAPSPLDSDTVFCAIGPSESGRYNLSFELRDPSRDESKCDATAASSRA
jgi:hypothetical protein